MVKFGDSYDELLALLDEQSPAKVALDVTAGDRLRIETPGGGAWGKPGQEPREG